MTTTGPTDHDHDPAVRHAVRPSTPPLTVEQHERSVMKAIERIDANIAEQQAVREQANINIRELRKERAEFVRCLPRKPRAKKAAGSGE